MPRGVKPYVSVPSYEHLSSVLRDIEHDKWRPFFSMLYLCGARISERPIKWETREKDGNRYAIAYLNTRKNPVQKMRSVPINRDKERDLVNMINEYRQLVRNDPEMYEISNRYIERMYRRYLRPAYPETYPHFLREFRIHHVVTEPEKLGIPHYREDQLCQYFGWSDWDSARPYRHLRVSSLL